MNGVLYNVFFILYLFYAFNFILRISCIVFFAFHSLHFILFSVFSALYSTHCNLCIVLYIYYCILYAMQGILCIVFYNSGKFGIQAYFNLIRRNKKTPPLTSGLKLEDGAGPSQAEHISEADLFMVLLAKNTTIGRQLLTPSQVRKKENTLYTSGYGRSC